MADKDHKKLHAIMIAYPLQGHIIPTVHLAIKLASKGFTITFINTQSIHHQISKSNPPPPPPPSSTAVDGGDFFAGARNSGLDIRYATVCDGLPLGFDRSLNHDQFMECLLHVFSAHVDELVGKIVRSELESECPVTCLIADTFFVWPSVIAKKYNLVHVSFWTEPALVLTLYYHLELLRKNGHFASHGSAAAQNRGSTTVPNLQRHKQKRPKQEHSVAAFTRVLDEASVVLLFRDKVYLHPDKLSKLVPVFYQGLELEVLGAK